MRKSRQGESDPLELDMTPMIDIVFNLLIFFMCATTFRTEEGLIQAFLPKNQGPNSSSAAMELCDVRLKLLWLDAGGEPTEGADGRVVVKIAGNAYNAPGELGPGSERSPVWRRLHDDLARFKAAYTGGNPDGFPVIIDARPQVPTQHVVSALNEVVRAKITNVTFAQPEHVYAQ